MKIFVYCLSALLVFGAALSLRAQDFVVLESWKGKTTSKGNAALATYEASTASTFKVALAWAGIELGLVDSLSLKKVADKHVPGSPREVTLTQAMFFSSNDYFKELGKEIGNDELLIYARKTELFTKVPDKNWIGPDFGLVERGGVMKTTPLLNHSFMKKIASGSWIAKTEVQKELEKAMCWPSPQPDIQLFGKTGTIKGAVWFNGYGRTPQGTKVVTVFIPGTSEDRPRAIGLFYEAFGLKWDESLGKSM